MPKVSKILLKVFGSRNERLIKAYSVIAVQAGAFEEQTKKLDDESLKAKTAEVKAAIKAEGRGWNMSKAETDAKIATLKENGIKIITPSAELMSSLKEIGKTMSDEWSKKAGADGAALLKAYHDM